MRSYEHFTLSERRSLSQMLEKQQSLRSIAREMQRNVSTISRELRRNTQAGEPYSPEKATVSYFIRRRNSVRKPILSQHPDCLAYIEKKLKCFWPPQTIVSRRRKKHPNEFMVSVSTVYRAIDQGLIHGCTAKTHLRRHGIPYKPTRTRYYAIQPEHTIAEFPPQAVKRLRVGDWEGDTICGVRGSGGLLSLIDRKTRYCLLRYVPDMSADTMEKTLVSSLRNRPLKTLLLDNGSEFSRHRQIAKTLRTTIYFADPHAPWQRGSNECNNGRVRFFFPKGTDTRSLSQKDVAHIQYLLNNRPLKCLDWLTPSEAFSAKCCN